MRRILVLLLVLLPAGASAQILNTLVGFEQEPGWSGKIAASLGAKGGNSELASLRSSGLVQWQGQRSRWRLIGAFDKTRSGEEDLSESIVGHLRNNYRLGSSLATVAFAQLQRNPFQRLDSRTLVGAGLRFDLLRTPQDRVGLGVTHMLERERLRDLGRADLVQRLSAFMDVGLELREGVELGAVGFLQPRWSDFSDVRVHLMSELEVKLVGALSLTVTLTLSHDSQPPPEVLRADWSLDTGLSYEL